MAQALKLTNINLELHVSEHNILKQAKIDPTDTNNARKTSKKKSTKSLKGSSKSTKFKINDWSFEEGGSIMDEATKKNERNLRYFNERH